MIMQMTFLILCLLSRAPGFRISSVVTSQRRRALQASTTSSQPNDATTRTSAPSSSFSFPQVSVQRNRQSKSFREGNPLIFTKSVASLNGASNMEMASLVQVEVPMDKSSTQQQSQIIGWGVYNPHSMYRVRILCHALGASPILKQELQAASSQEEALKLILRQQLQQAVHIRNAMGLLENDQTDTFRLVNGEGDGLSGLAVDVIGGQVAVVMSSAAWCQVHRDVILECLKRLFNQYDMEMDIVWKTTPARLKQDGMEQVEEKEVDATEQDDDDKRDTQVIATELGIQYATFPYQKGQKTGYYCDQRENRWTLAQYVSNKKNARVLDLCCYHGGFALNAAIHGHAMLVTGVDSSQDAIDACYRNAKLNNVDDVEFIKMDVAKFMKQANERGDEYDVIVLDPPKLAPSTNGLDRAKRKYHGLNRDALKLVNEKDGGLFMTCTCSAAMTQKDGGHYFLKMVQQAALAAGRRITLLQTHGAAPCHSQSPASYPAGSYLTAALFYVSPMT